MSNLNKPENIEENKLKVEVEKKSKSKARIFFYLFFTIFCILAVGASILINYIQDKKLTWSFYAIYSVPYFWIIILGFTAKKEKLLLGISGITMLAAPFLYFLENITPSKGWFYPLALPLSVCGSIYLWVLYILFKKVKINIPHKFAGAIFFGGIIGFPMINNIADKYLLQETSLRHYFIVICASLSAFFLFLVIGAIRQNIVNKRIKNMNK